MSEENVEIVRRCYEFLESRDESLIVELIDPDVVYDLLRNVFNPGIYVGHDGLRRFIEQVDSMWEGFRMDPEEFFDGGDYVVCAARMTARGRQSGVPAEMRLLNVWQLRDGKVVRMTGGYRERSDALEAAGLSE